MLYYIKFNMLFQRKSKVLILGKFLVLPGSPSHRLERLVPQVLGQFLQQRRGVPEEPAIQSSWCDDSDVAMISNRLYQNR